MPGSGTRCSSYIGVVSTKEPFQKLFNQGMILGEDNEKMSKSRGNVIPADKVLGEYGADAVRLYEMFLGPLEQVKPWNTKRHRRHQPVPFARMATRLARAGRAPSRSPR